MFDTEKFMREVEQRPIIYDLQLKDYSNRRMKAKCWSEVGESMYDEWNSMKTEEKTGKVKLMMKKWKTLRDNFVREYKLIRKAERGMAASKKKPYIFFRQLQFLIPHLRKNKNTASNISSPDDDSQPHSSTEQIDYDDNNNNQQKHINQTKGCDCVNENCCSRKSGNKQSIGNRRKAILTAIKKLIDILSESISFQKEERNSDQFGNKAFMLSFIPLMNNLPQHVSLQVRMKILQIFSDLADSVFFSNRDSSVSCLSTLSPGGPSTPISSDIDDLSCENFSIPDFLHL